MYGCTCKFKRKPILKLRGLYSGSNIDNFYTLHQQNSLAFYGLTKTKINYNENKAEWEVIVVSSPTTAHTKTKSGKSMILGKHTWQIQNDSHSCNDGKPYITVLKMTSCDDGQFTCWDGQCVHMAERCDQIAQCRDRSDEKGCQIISIDENYNKNIPPFDEKSKAKVNVSMVFLSINDISEISLTIDIKYTISLQWYETDHIQYYNLKPKLSSNVLSLDEITDIWTPYVIYVTTDNNEATNIVHKFKDIRTTMAVSREGEFIRSSIESVDEIEYFKVNI